MEGRNIDDGALMLKLEMLLHLVVQEVEIPSVYQDGTTSEALDVILGKRTSGLIAPHGRMLQLQAHASVVEWGPPVCHTVFQRYIENTSCEDAPYMGHLTVKAQQCSMMLFCDKVWQPCSTTAILQEEDYLQVSDAGFIPRLCHPTLDPGDSEDVSTEEGEHKTLLGAETNEDVSTSALDDFIHLSTSPNGYFDRISSNKHVSTITVQPSLEAIELTTYIASQLTHYSFDILHDERLESIHSFLSTDWDRKMAVEKHKIRSGDETGSLVLLRHLELMLLVSRLIETVVKKGFIIAAYFWLSEQNQSALSCLDIPHKDKLNMSIARALSFLKESVCQCLISDRPHLDVLDDCLEAGSTALVLCETEAELVVLDAFLSHRSIANFVDCKIHQQDISLDKYNKIIYMDGCVKAHCMPNTAGISTIHINSSVGVQKNIASSVNQLPCPGTVANSKSSILSSVFGSQIPSLRPLGNVDLIMDQEHAVIIDSITVLDGYKNENRLSNALRNYLSVVDKFKCIDLILVFGMDGSPPSQLWEDPSDFRNPVQEQVKLVSYLSTALPIHAKVHFCRKECLGRLLHSIAPNEKDKSFPCTASYTELFLAQFPSLNNIDAQAMLTSMSLRQLFRETLDRCIKAVPSVNLDKIKKFKNTLQL